jgi:hypothetical protein
MIDELERVWREVVRSLIGVLFLRLPGGAEENHENAIKLAYVPADNRIEQPTNGRAFFFGFVGWGETQSTWYVGH